MSNDEEKDSVPTGEDRESKETSVPSDIPRDGEGKPLSKKALKRKQRWEQKMELKRRRKQQEKEIKIAKAKAQGRDLDRERKEQEERAKSGEGHRRREKVWQKRLKGSADSSFRICLDCAFEDHMTYKEINSLSMQVRYCYAANKRARNPIYLSVASLSGQTRTLLEKVCGFPDQWFSRAFTCSDKPVQEMHGQSKDKLVYLTSDSNTTLEKLEDDKIYIIGGIVDRNRLKGAAIERAESLGIATARLPINDHLKMFATKVLTCNHVFEILLKYREFGNDWKKAMMRVLPPRKDAQPAESESVAKNFKRTEKGE